jgi:hypothetical protein
MGQRRLVVRRLLLCAGVSLALATAAAPGAAVARPGGGQLIPPHEPFVGLLNGRDGASGRVMISMACAGPVVPGRTGHPFGGQTVGVGFPEATAGTFGNTGSKGTSVVAYFGAPPPTSATGSVTFHKYGTVAMPTSLVLPCSGTGTVTFVALPTSPTARSYSVPVSYVGQP